METQPAPACSGATIAHSSPTESMMDNAKAKAVLVEMLGVDGILSDDSIYDGGCFDIGIERIFLIDHKVTADQLEAIAAWMRDPKGVSEA
jgi:hypothetical protein